MLNLIGVTVVLGRRTIFDNLCFSINDPGLYFILGANASGKTTLMRVMSGRFKPQKGKVLIFGAELYKLFGPSVPAIEVVSGSYTMNLELTIGSIFRSRAEAFGYKKSFSDFCRSFNLPKSCEELQRATPSQLSSSELKEVELAMVLMGSPSVLFIDDCFLFFSRESIERVMENLRFFSFYSEASGGEARQNGRLAVVFSSRFFGNMDAFRDVFLLRDGKLEALSKPVMVNRGTDPLKVEEDEKKKMKGRVVVVRCGEYFYRHSRIEAENDYFLLHAVLENSLVIELKQSLDLAISYLEQNGLDILELDFGEKNLATEIDIGHSL